MHFFPALEVLLIVYFCLFFSLSLEENMYMCVCDQACLLFTFFFFLILNPPLNTWLESFISKRISQSVLCTGEA